MYPYTLVMDDMNVRNAVIEDSEIPGILDSGFYCAVLKVVDGEILYADVDWEKYEVAGWKLPEQGES